VKFDHSVFGSQSVVVWWVRLIKKPSWILGAL